MAGFLFAMLALPAGLLALALGIAFLTRSRSR